MCSLRDTAIVDRLSSFDRLVEVGIGSRTDVAAALAERGTTVIAVDIHERTVPDSIQFVQDDLTAPRVDVYETADALYGLRLPPELHRSVATRAHEAGIPVLFTTLGGDPPTVPVTPEQLPGTTLYRVDDRRPVD